MVIIEMVVFSSLVVLLTAHEIVIFKKLCSANAGTDEEKAKYLYPAGVHVPRVWGVYTNSISVDYQVDENLKP